MPTSVTGCVPALVASATSGWPTLRSSSSAVFLMTATSPGFSGRRPSIATLGLIDSSTLEKTSAGAPWDSMMSPLTTS